MNIKLMCLLFFYYFSGNLALCGTILNSRTTEWRKFKAKSVNVVVFSNVMCKDVVFLDQMYVVTAGKDKKQRRLFDCAYVVFKDTSKLEVGKLEKSNRRFPPPVQQY